MCKISSPIYTVRSFLGKAILPKTQGTPCDVRVLKINTELWYKLRKPNEWIIILPTITTIRIICFDKSESKILNGTGIFSLLSGCSAETEYIKMVTEEMLAIDATTSLINQNLTDYASLKINLTIPDLIHMPHLNFSLIDTSSNLHQFSKGLKEIEMELETMHKNQQSKAKQSLT